MDRFIRFEHKSQRIVPRRLFIRRVGRNLAVGLGIIAASLLVGIVGFMVFEGKDWISAYDNAAMILSGMGPFDIAASDAGRLFEGTYALYAGLMVVLVAGLVLAPVFHRVLHSFHVEDDDDEKRAERGEGKPRATRKPANKADE